MEMINRIRRLVLGFDSGDGQFATAGGFAPKLPTSPQSRISAREDIATETSEEFTDPLRRKFSQIRAEERNILDKLILVD